MNSAERLWQSLTSERAQQLVEELRRAPANLHSYAPVPAVDNYWTDEAIDKRQQDFEYTEDR